MRVWRWYRARRWYWQLLIGIVAVPVGLVALYVAGRSLQYAGAEKDAGLYVPATANVVVRAREFQAHFTRIEESLAWRVLRRKVLKDPALRSEINALLKANKLPTLDDLEDERKPFLQNRDLALGLAGRDVVVALQAGSSLPQAHLCAVVRLPWRYYLAIPFGRFFLPTEGVGDATALRFRRGKQDFFVASAGALVVVSSDRALLEEALKRKGVEESSGRPVEGRVVFEGSPALLQIRRALQESGAFPYVKFETARAMSFSVDLREAGLVFDARFEKAEPLRSEAPPLAVRAWAPTSTSGVMVTSTGIRDLMLWVRDLIGMPGPRDVGRRNALQALDQLDKGGLTNNFMPRLGEGMVVLTGVEEREGRVYPALALILPAKDPKGAVEAMNAVIKQVAGKMAEGRMKTQPVEDTLMHWWDWPDSFQIDDFLLPTYAAVKDAFVFGNNLGFTEAVIRTAIQGDGMEQTSAFRKLKVRLKEVGIASDPNLAGGFLYPPALRESLDGLLVQIAKQMVYATQDDRALRAEIEAELRAQARQATEAEIIQLFNEAIERKKRDKEDALRANLRVLDSVRWAAFDASTTPKGISFRLALELR